MFDPQELRKKIAQVLTENGLSGNSKLHGLHYQYPDRYGACSCVSDLLDALLQLVLAELAEVWQAGAAHGSNAPCDPWNGVCLSNPYLPQPNEGEK